VHRLIKLNPDEALEARRFADALQQSYETEPMLLELELHVARREMHDRAERLDPALPVTVSERRLGAGGSSVEASFFIPKAVLGVYLHIHGGGWCIGSSRTQDARLGALSAVAHLAVVSVDYRLAPEHPFPAALCDCITALRWALEAAEEEFGSSALVIGGESAGAHLAAMSLLSMRDEGAEIDLIRGVNLSFGVFDLGLTPTQRLFGSERLGLTTELLERCYALFVPDRTREQRRAAAISPLYADLTGLPPAHFTVGQRDLLLDDTLFMFERWRAAGNVATLNVYPEALHGFLSHPIAVARRANRDIQQWLHGCALSDSHRPGRRP
jgi:acetyl esterase/lipase